MDIPRIKALDHSVSKTAAHFPDRLFLRDALNPEKTVCFSYQQANEDIHRLALQIQKGFALEDESIGVMLSTSYECICLVYAGMRAGKNIVFIDPEWGEVSKLSIIQKAGIKRIASSEKIQGELAAFQIPLEFGSREPFAPLPDQLSEKTKLIIFTSGTTSQPKGIVLSQNAMIQAYHIGQKCLLVDHNTNSGCFYRISGLGILGINIFFPILFGGSVTLLPTYSYFFSEEFWSLIKRFHISFLYMVPPIATYLIKEGKALEKKFTREEILCVAGSARLEPAIQDEFQSKFGPLANIYGLSECGFAFLFGNAKGDKYDNSVGPALGLELKLQDADGNEITKPHQKGCLFVKTPSLFEGYLHEPELTKTVVNQGWLDTRDLAYFDEKKCFHIVGRMDGTIKKGGNLFHLSECEEYLNNQESVMESCCVKISCEIYGEDYLAFVRLKENHFKIFKKQLEESLKYALGNARTPRDIILLNKELPRNGAGKYNRNALLGMWKEGE